jgi:predicted nucleotidyltransferase
MVYGLNDNIIKKIKEIFQLFPEVEKVILFGSRAIGTFKEGSDIDLAIIGSVNFNIKLSISQKMDELNLPYKIDIIEYEKIKETELLNSINKYGIIIYENIG